jgi:hypothetical protein
MALQPLLGPGLFFSSVIILYTDVRTPWTSVSPSQGRYLHTGQHKHRINAYTDIYTLSGIRTNDPSFRASEESSCLRPRSHRDRRMLCMLMLYAIYCDSVVMDLSFHTDNQSMCGAQKLLDYSRFRETLMLKYTQGGQTRPIKTELA